MKILLVDDDAFLRDMYATKFTLSGDEVVAVEDGKTALQLLREQTFDVMLLDMVMPLMTGLELLDAMNAEQLGKGMKRIVLSNQGEPSDKEGATARGADGYIVKAEKIPSEVVEAVRKIMKG